MVRAGHDGGLDGPERQADERVLEGRAARVERAVLVGEVRQRVDLGARDLEPEVGEDRLHALLARRAPQERPGLVGREVRDDELAAGLELRGPLREDARPVLARALAAGPSPSSDYPGPATCALLTKYSKCPMSTRAAAAADTSSSTYCSCNPLVTGQCTDTTAIPAKSVGCALDDSDCELADKTGIQTNVQQWWSEAQKSCFNDGGQDETCLLYTSPSPRDRG